MDVTAVSTLGRGLWGLRAYCEYLRTCSGEARALPWAAAPLRAWLASVARKVGGKPLPWLSGLRANGFPDPLWPRTFPTPSLQGSQVLAATYNQAAQLWKVGEIQSKVRPSWGGCLRVKGT